MTDAVLVEQTATVVLPQDDGTVVVLSYVGSQGVAGVPVQDFGWTLGGGLNSGEAIDTPPLQNPSTVTWALVHTRSGVESTKTFTVNLFRLGALVQTATFDLHIGDADIEVEFSPPFDGARRDVFQIVLPDPIGIQLQDLSVSLGSIR